MRMTEQAYQALINRSPVPPPGAPTAPAKAAPSIPPLRGRVTAMNKTEAEYAQLLEARLHDGQIHWYRFEGIKLRLANNTFFNVDFAVLMPDKSVEFHEVKGYWRDDARVKIKVAAAQYPFRFVAVRKRKKRDGGGWAVEVFG